MTTFLHSGDMGDIVYALPTIRELGGGELLLDTSGGNSNPHVRRQTDVGGRDRLKFDEEAYNFLAPLIEVQPYIESVRKWDGGKVDYDLNEFRDYLTDPEVNLCYAHARAMKVDFAARRHWLDLPGEPAKKIYDLVCARCLRYTTAYNWWEMLAAFTKNHSVVFLGTDLEWEVFQHLFPGWRVERVVVDTALELAMTIEAGHSFLANQTLAMAIAVGLGANFTMEVFPAAPNCVFEWGTYI